jgi:hypothetical protein
MKKMASTMVKEHLNHFQIQESYRRGGKKSNRMVESA